jgi:hypothetical protein
VFFLLISSHLFHIHGLCIYFAKFRGGFEGFIKVADSGPFRREFCHLQDVPRPTWRYGPSPRTLSPLLNICTLCQPRSAADPDLHGSALNLTLDPDPEAAEKC